MSTNPYDAGQQPQRSGGGMSLLVIILIVLGVLLLLCAGICGGCMMVASRTAHEIGSAIELMPAMNAATSAVTSDPQVIDKLGEPVELSSIPKRVDSGELKPAGEDFQFTVRGPDGTADVLCTAEKDAGSWRVTTISVQTSDGSTFTVPPPEQTAPSVQFDMPPTPEKISEPSEEP